MPKEVWKEHIIAFTELQCHTRWWWWLPLDGGIADSPVPLALFGVFPDYPQ